MLRRDTGKFSRPLGVAYIIAQVAGAFLGGLISYFQTHEANSLGVSEAKYVGQAMVAEAIGAFFLTFLYLTQTEEKTKLSKDPAITTLIMAAAYLAAMFIVSGPDDGITPLNPAIALGTMFQQVYHGQSDGFQYIYVYIPFPFAGAALAVVFHEFVYKRVSETIQESEDVDHVLDKTDDEDVLGNVRN